MILLLECGVWRVVVGRNKLLVTIFTGAGVMREICIGVGYDSVLVGVYSVVVKISSSRTYIWLQSNLHRSTHPNCHKYPSLTVDLLSHQRW
jgi:hypothetical protein